MEILDPQLKQILIKTAKETGVKPKEVEEIYRSVFKFIKTDIASIDFRSCETVDKVQQVGKSYNIKGLGKFHVNIKAWEAMIASIFNNDKKEKKNREIKKEEEERKKLGTELPKEEDDDIVKYYK